MKKNVITFLLLSLFLTGFSQNSQFEYTGRRTPAIKQDRLWSAKFISEIMPGFSQRVILPPKEYALLNDRVKVVDQQRQNYVYPRWNCIRATENYEEVIDFVFVEITALCKGILYSAQGNCNALTAEQRNILNTADLGTDIHVRIKFKYKSWALENPSACGSGGLTEGAYDVTVVPETEAEYPGGFKALSTYINGNIFAKTAKNDVGRLLGAVVKFSVEEKGQVSNITLPFSSKVPEIDKRIKEAIQKMPSWKPAKNNLGIPVKQEFNIPFSGNIGC